MAPVVALLCIFEVEEPPQEPHKTGINLGNYAVLRVAYSVSENLHLQMFREMKRKSSSFNA